MGDTLRFRFIHVSSASGNGSAGHSALVVASLGNAVMGDDWWEKSDEETSPCRLFWVINVVSGDARRVTGRAPGRGNGGGRRASPDPGPDRDRAGGGGTPAEFMFSTSFDLAQVGYRESEFFLSGTASGYTSATPLTSDGKWAVTPNGTAPYTTRAVVRRPVDPKKFNGTVIVESYNFV